MGIDQRRRGKHNILREVEEFKVLDSINIMFGMPSRDCAFSGICRIESKMKNDHNCQDCFSVGRLVLVGKKQINFDFLKTSMKATTIEKYFGSGHFIIIEAYEMPEFVNQALGMKQLLIQPGIYPVVENEDHLSVKVAVLDLANPQ